MDQPATETLTDQAHDHAHDHLSAERAANLAENPHAGQGAVMLDIGGDVGALVVHFERSWEGVEIEIETADGTVPTGLDHHHSDDQSHGHAHRAHVAVVGRPAGGDTFYSAVFPRLQDGRYALGMAGRETMRLVDLEVRGGAVTELEWPDPDPDAA